MSVETSTKKRTNLSINQKLLDEAKKYGVNLSNAAEIGIQEALASRKREKWLEQNSEAIESSNSFVNENGLPLSKFRNF